MAGVRKDSKGRILAKGESQRKDGLYQYRFIDADNVRKTVYAGNLKDLRQMEREITASLVVGKRVKTTVTGVQLCERYFHLKESELASGRIKPTTLISYRCMLKAVAKYPLFRMYANKVTMGDAKQWATSLCVDGEMKSGSAKNLISFVKCAFDVGVENDIVFKNPFAFKKNMFAKDALDIKSLTPDEQRNLAAFVGKVCKPLHRDIFFIMLNTGVRVSELVGITVKDIDFENLCLNIDKQVISDSNGHKYVSTPKSRNGVRKIPITKETAEAFRRVIDSRRAGKSAVIDGYSDFVFVSCSAVMSVTSIRERFVKLAQEYNAQYGANIRLTPHVLRHTYCTNLSSAGVHPKVMQYLMGHSSPSVTQAIYDHADYARARATLSGISTTPFTTPFA